MTMTSFTRFLPSAQGTLVALSLLLSAFGFAAMAVPAAAQSNDYRCTALAEQAQAAAAAATGPAQAAATRKVAVGTKLCAAGNRSAAAKEFRAALKLAGVAETPEPKAAAG